MKIAFFGCTNFSKEIIEAIIPLKDVEICAIFSIPQEFNISYSKTPVVNTNYADLSTYALKVNAPFIEINSTYGNRLKDHFNLIQALDLDVLLVMGWYYMIPKNIRNLARWGAWGLHASLLPKYAGGAPLVWAIINGEKKTGVTLFRLDNGVDDGDIILQQSFDVLNEDTIKEVYDKATIASKAIVTKVLKSTSSLKFQKQDKTKIEVYPQRKPEDGLIDWTWNSEKIRNFIRAQTKPYPGAFTILNGKKVTIWDARIEDL